MRALVKLGIMLVAMQSVLATAENSVAECSKAIVYDSGLLKQNFVSRLAVWETIDKTDYERQQAAAGATVPILGLEVPLTYEQFSEERARVRQSFALQQQINVSSNAKWESVNSQSTEMYRECLARITKIKFVASVVYANRNTVVVQVAKNEDPGRSNEDFVKVVKVTGGTADRTEAKMKNSSKTDLTFTRTVGEPIDITLVLVTKDDGEIDSASFSLPRYTHIVNKPTEVPVTSNIVRCENSFLGGAQGIMEIVAGTNQTLIPGSHAQQYVALDPARCPLAKATVSVESVTPRKAIASGVCASNRNTCTAPVHMWFTMRASQDNFVDEEQLESVRKASGRLLNGARLAPHPG